MAMRGITIRVNRAQAIRAIGTVMREKKASFDLEKVTFPKRLQAARDAVTRKLQARLNEVKKADSRRLNSIVGDDLIGWKERAELIPSPPELNVCREKYLLLMLQQDVRDIIPVNSNHDLWAVLQGKCEVAR